MRQRVLSYPLFLLPNTANMQKARASGIFCPKAHNTTCGLGHRLITRHEGFALFATLNCWHYRVEKWRIKELIIVSSNRILLSEGFRPFHHYSLNFLRPLSLSISLLGINMMYNEHTHSYTSCQDSQDTLLLLLIIHSLRGRKRFSQPIKK